MFHVQVLGSGSDGNCILVETNQCKFLLDVGLPINETKDKLRSFGVKLSEIDYIFVTHAHMDHIQSLESIMKIYDIKVISSFSTLLGVDIPMSNVIELEGGQYIELEYIKVTAHEVSHDAAETLAFTIQNEFGERMLYMTDVGVTPEGDFSNYDLYIIEANYSYEMLRYNYKFGDLHMAQVMRTHGDEGHLSIEDCIDFLQNNIGMDTVHIVLSHLSGRNGNKELFLEKANEAIPLMNIDVAEYGLDIKVGQTLPF